MSQLEISLQSKKPFTISDLYVKFGVLEYVMSVKKGVKDTLEKEKRKKEVFRQSSPKPPWHHTGNGQLPKNVAPLINQCNMTITTKWNAE